MSASKRQGIIAIGVCCILVSVLLVFYGISQPKVNETPLSQLQDTLSQTSIKTSSSDKNDASFKNSGADTQTTVFNTKISTLPSTGGIGTTIFYVVGSILVLGAAILLITKKRMSAR